ncbi:MAG TPA: FAD-dependent oxidoreductase [Rhodobacteraceae bacterium]|jgi:glycine oxidase|nr:FAD-dependent oxidoreductase [Paracoccaceae bacterium]HBV56099.1 FAD-dependent oxidoreductase [Paracoccaceae bacterium]
MARMDVTVRGAGIFGLAIAWECLRRGARVRVIDVHGPGAGSSGGIVGALAPHVPEQWNSKKAFQFESLIAAEPFFQSVEVASGLSTGYGRTGRVQPVVGPEARALAQARAAGAATLWPGHRWEIVEAARFGGWGLTGEVIYDTLSARMHPRQACAALVAALEGAGAEVVTGAAAIDIAEEGRVVHATGLAGLLALSHGRGRGFGSGVKGQSALFDAPGLATLPQLFIETLHVIAHADGTVALGSTSENTYEDPTRTDAQLDALIERARELVPPLRDAPVIERWAGVRPRARSRAPVLGHYPDRPGHYIANGGFKIGFGMAAGVARVMADLLLEDHHDIPPAFAPETCF